LTPSEAPALPAGAFQKLVADWRASIESKEQNPSALGDLLVQRMREFRVTTVETVLDVIHASREYESSESLKEHSKSFHYPNTIRLIDTLLPLATNCDDIEAELRGEKAEDLQQSGNSSAAAAEFQISADVAASAGYRADLRKLRSVAARGAILEGSGDSAGAADAYRLVLSYDFYKVANSETEQECRKLYIDAGGGLIRVSRHDTAALDNIFFVPSAKQELQPALDAAKAEAALK
jgi:hypothetical protein